MPASSPRPSSTPRSSRSSAPDAAPCQDLPPHPEEFSMTTAPVQMLVVSFDEPNFSGEIIEG